MLDYYFSSFLLQVGLFILLAIIVCMLFYVSPICDGVDSLLKRLKLFRYRRVILGIALALMLSPLALPIFNSKLWGYGLVDKFDEAGRVDGYLYAIDDHAIGGGKLGPPSHYLRLHIIDLATGRRLHRHIIGNTGLTGYRGPMAFGASGEKRLLVSIPGKITAYNLRSGRREYIITKDSLAELVAGLNKQVTGFTFRKRSSILDVLTVDGFQILVNPFTLKVENAFRDTYANPETYRFDRAETASGSTLLLSPGPRKILLSAKGVPVGGNEVFIEGSILRVVPRAHIMVIVSYPDMNKRSVILSGISREGKRLWHKDQSQFTSAQSPVIDFSAISNENLIVLMDGHISSINVHNGTVNWERRY